MIHDGQVCASVPVETFSVAVHWCEAHQAFVVSGYGFRQDDEDSSSIVWEPAPVELGPFDGLGEVGTQLDLMMHRLQARLVARHAAARLIPANPNA